MTCLPKQQLDVGILFIVLFMNFTKQPFECIGCGNKGIREHAINVKIV